MPENYVKVPKPFSKEFDKRFSSAYKRYAGTKPAAIENSRIRPKDEDIFDWLMADKESVKETNEAMKSAGLSW
jgi:hypothetical protein